MLLLWLVPAVATGPYTLRLGEVARSGQQVQLPGGAESAQVARLLNPDGADEPLPLAVIWTPRADGAQITATQQETARRVTARLAGTAVVPMLAADGRAVTAVIAAGPDNLPTHLKSIGEAAAAVPGMRVHLAGPAAEQADLDGAFAQTDGVLPAVTLSGVLLILLVVYRSVLTAAAGDLGRTAGAGRDLRRLVHAGPAGPAADRRPDAGHRVRPRDRCEHRLCRPAGRPPP
ncbi:MMPL family transporter [Streptomyces sp. NPDC001717]|uniref:MMPL family transporter n=1 Tax=Streptomyces sp. NPDC001717 TaxID=3364604 RepID=UPI0036C9AC92